METCALKPPATSISRRFSNGKVLSCRFSLTCKMVQKTLLLIELSYSAIKV